MVPDFRRQPEQLLMAPMGDIWMPCSARMSSMSSVSVRPGNSRRAALAREVLDRLDSVGDRGALVVDRCIGFWVKPSPVNSRPRRARRGRRRDGSSSPAVRRKGRPGAAPPRQSPRKRQKPIRMPSRATPSSGRPAAAAVHRWRQLARGIAPSGLHFSTSTIVHPATFAPPGGTSFGRLSIGS